MREAGTDGGSLAIAFKVNEWTLISTELIDLGQIRQWFPSDVNLPESKHNSAMLCVLQHNETGKLIIVGNTQFENRQEFDHVKFA